MAEVPAQRAPVLTYKVREVEIPMEEITRRLYAGEHKLPSERADDWCARDSWEWQVLLDGAVIASGLANREHEARGRAIDVINRHDPDHLDAIAWGLEHGFIARAEAVA